MIVESICLDKNVCRISHQYLCPFFKTMYFKWDMSTFWYVYRSYVVSGKLICWICYAEQTCCHEISLCTLGSGKNRQSSNCLVLMTAILKLYHLQRSASQCIMNAGVLLLFFLLASLTNDPFWRWIFNDCGNRRQACGSDTAPFQLSVSGAYSPQLSLRLPSQAVT